MKTKITSENYHIKTKAKFTYLGYGEKAQEIFDDLKEKFGIYYTSDSLSCYIIDNENNLYRYSDHWINFSNCSWGISYFPTWIRTQKKHVIGKVSLDDMVLISEYEELNSNPAREIFFSTIKDLESLGTFKTKKVYNGIYVPKEEGIYCYDDNNNKIFIKKVFAQIHSEGKTVSEW